MCSTTCGTGIQQFTRSKKLFEKYGGACDGNYTKDQECNQEECPGKRFLTIFVPTGIICVCVLLIYRNV